MTAFYIPQAMRGKTPDGKPYAFFRGIHAVPDSLANHGDANKLGIKPVDEMTDAEWAGLALDKAKWLAANRPQPAPIDLVEAEPEKAEDAPASHVKTAEALAPVGDAKSA